MTAFDRATHLRPKKEAIEALLRTPATLLVPVWRDRHLTGDDGVVLVPRSDELVERATDVVFLGMLGDVACFAAGFPAETEAPPLEGSWNDGRAVLALAEHGRAALCSHARALLHWHRHTRFCGRCGAATVSEEGGHVRTCTACARKTFPRTDPAIMALVVHEDRVLLARQPTFPPSMYSILAGFVEPGETLEEAVVREVREEVGVDAVDVRYLRSQPWPFPQSLMLGFVMRARAPELVVDRTELEEARWVSRADLPEPGTARDGLWIPPRFSLAGQLLALYRAGDVP
jgi:NAD+ diphosphatase